MREENGIDIIVTQKPDGRMNLSLPASVLPQLNEWTGRLQRELGKPLELDDVALAYALVAQKLKPGSIISLADFFDLVKAKAVFVFDIMRRTPGESSMEITPGNYPDENVGGGQ